jgi:hypothetical protein
MIESKSRLVYGVIAIAAAVCVALGVLLPAPPAPPVSGEEYERVMARLEALERQLEAPDPGMQFGLGGSGVTNLDSLTLSADLTAVNGTFSGAVSTGALTPTSLTASGASDLGGNVSSSTGAVTVTDAVYVTSTLETVGSATVGGSLTLESVAFSGPTTFGSASGVVSGTTIAHGLSTTPTAVLLTPVSTGGYTTTVPYVIGTDTTSITVGVADGVSISTLYWLAGK